MKAGMKSYLNTVELISESGTNPCNCFQCNKCSAGCPVAYEMDLTPSQIIQAIKLGHLGLVFSSRTIWLCASCETCSTRCPQGVDIAGIMDACRILAKRKKIRAQEPAIHSFFESMLSNMRIFGRLYEIGLILALKLKTGELRKDMDIGLKMFFKGKLKILPERVANTKKMRKIFDRVGEIEKTSK